MKLDFFTVNCVLKVGILQEVLSYALFPHNRGAAGLPT